MIIAIDFDDTLFAYVPAPPGIPDYSGRPGSIGAPNHAILFQAKQRKAAGDQLILWTCREGDALTEAVEICRLHGLEFDAVNQNLPGRCRSGAWPDSRKVHADEYWDDKSVKIQGFWE